MGKSPPSEIFDKIFLSSIRPPLWLFLLGLALYLQILNFGFSPLDDNYLYLDKIRWFMQIGNLPEVFYTSIAGFYRPILFVTFFYDAILGSGSPLTFHLTNLILHIASSILLYYFLCHLKISKTCAFFLSLIFIVHPVNVQTVAWIPGRNDSLLAVFTMTAIIFFRNYLKTQRPVFLLLHLITYLFALLTKENAIVIPLMLFLLINYTSQPPEKKIPKEIYLVWGLMTGIWFFFQRLLVNEFTVTDFSHLPASLLHFTKAWIFNSGKLLLPVYQSLLPTNADTPVLPFLSVIFIFILILFYLGIIRKRLFYFGLAWYALFLFIPTLWSSIDKIGEYYEQRLYLPLIGLLIMVSGISIKKIPVKWKKILPLSLFTVVMAAFFFKTDHRSQVYADKLAFGTACVKESPNHARSYKLYGTALSELGRHEEAIENFSRSIELYPNDEAAFYNRGSSQFQLGYFEKAIQDYNRAIEIKPDYLEAYNNRGIAYGNLGKIDQAEEDFDYVIEHDPDNDKAYSNKGLNSYRSGNISAALDCFNMAIKLNDNLEFGYNNRGQIYLDMDSLELALNDFNRAIQINPNYLSPYVGRAKLYRKLKLFDLAKKDIDFVMQLQPDLSLDLYIDSTDTINK